ncbi:hypothetical protein [Streptomyces sp. NPDC056069]|uniref:hypothetical protein n=1 Tax=Streptomyces TaxID=1883 RepID=UPI00073DC09F|nr:hypothetical protein [Streptomyces sp. SID7810]CUW30097.1 hypothetical protein TUE45_04816 [Streptomyces reticuli]
MPDYIHSADELGRALYVYAATVARVLHESKEPCRFRLVAYCLKHGHPLGIHEWTVSAETGRLVPAGEPWVVYDEEEERAAA